MHLPELRLPHLPTGRVTAAEGGDKSRQRRSTIHTTADVKPARPLPTGLMSGLRSWIETGEKEAAKSELRILRRMPYFRLPHEPDPEPSQDTSAAPSVVARQYELEVSPGLFINALEIRRARAPLSLSSSVRPPTQDEGEQEIGEAYVFAPGYGCGLCHYWRQFDSMADIVRESGGRCFFIDWMGMGRSTRRNPKVFAPMRKMSEKDGVDGAEDFFLEPLYAFFQKKQITKAALVGHSLGGYLAAAFSLRHPELVKSLMLLSPAGIPSHPGPPCTPPPTPNQSRRPSQPTEDVNETASPSTAAAPDPVTGGIDGRRLEQALLRSASREAADQSLSMGAAPEGDQTQRSSDGREPANNWDSPSAARQFEAAVEAGAMPEGAGIIREDPLEDGEDDSADEEGERKPQTFKGPLGNGKAMQKLYAYMWNEGYSPLGFLRKVGPVGPLMLGKYSKTRFGGLEPDEQSELNSYLTSITLLPGSGEYAIGILLRPGAFARFPIAERIAALGKDIPVRLVYGALDWMDVHGGKDAVRALRRVGNRQSEVAITPEAGHHVYIDNPGWMNDYLIAKLRPSAAGADSPPATPVSSGTPTPASTALGTPRPSVAHPPLSPAPALGKPVDNVGLSPLAAA